MNQVEIESEEIEPEDDIPDDIPEQNDEITQENKKRKKTVKAKRNFPINTIEDSFKIAETIKLYNAGNPWAPKEISNILNAGVGNRWFYLTTSSRDYGITIGTRDTEKIEISEFGKKLVYPKSKEEECNAIKQAFLNVELFKWPIPAKVTGQSHSK